MIFFYIVKSPKSVADCEDGKQFGLKKIALTAAHPAIGRLRNISIKVKKRLVCIEESIDVLKHCFNALDRSPVANLGNFPREQLEGMKKFTRQNLWPRRELCKAGVRGASHCYMRD